MEADVEVFCVPLYLRRIDSLLSDQDTVVLSTALSMCCSIMDDNDDRKAFLKKVGPRVVHIFLRSKDEEIRKQAIKVVLMSQKCDGIADVDLGKVFVAPSLVHFAKHHLSLVKLFDLKTAVRWAIRLRETLPRRCVIWTNILKMMDAAIQKVSAHSDSNWNVRTLSDVGYHLTSIHSPDFIFSFHL